MLKALERSVASVDERIVLLAPSARSVSEFFSNVDVDADRYDQLIHDVQRFRGRIYLQDGAIEQQELSVDGLHQTPDDDRSWHMILLNREQQVSACAWCLEHEDKVALDDLRMRHIPLAHQDEWRPKVRKAIKGELARARRNRLQYVELGGWAVAQESRRTSAPLTVALAAYGFSRRHGGGALGMTTATFRHCSATILQRLGWSRFEVDGVTLPPYYDPRYKCMMEILRFDSRKPNPRYASLIDRLRAKLADVLVVTRSEWTTAVNPHTAVALGDASHLSVPA
jgi:hypothetical protein